MSRLSALLCLVPLRLLPLHKGRRDVALTN
jgi:hypothetical protein